MKGDAAMLNINKKWAIVISAFAASSVLTLLAESNCFALLNKSASASKLFHKGGTGDCDGCHLMHNSEEEWEDNNDMGRPTKNAHRLRGSDPSSTCLNCHESSIGNPVMEQFHIS